jgi:hypothetical protein
MTLLLQSGEADAYPLTRAVLRRTLHQADQWSVELEQSGQLSPLIEFCLANPDAEWRLVILEEGKGLTPAAPKALSPPLRVGPGNSNHELVTFTPVPPEDPPRSRVLTGYLNLRALFTHFARAVMDNEVASALEAQKAQELAPQAAGTQVGGVVAQHARSDREQLEALLLAWNRRHPGRPLALACAPGERSFRWRVRPCWPGAPSQLLETGTWAAKGWAPAGPPWWEAPAAQFQRIETSWDLARWQGAGKALLPQRLPVAGGSLVVLERIDELTVGQGGAGGQISWSVTCRAGRLQGFQSEREPDVAVALGVVQSANAITATVHLDGYPSGKPGRVRCHLATPNSGTGDFAGLHAPPYPGSRGLVLLPLHPFAGWPVFLNNVRVTAPPLGPILAIPEKFSIKAKDDLTCQGGNARVLCRQSRVDVETS